jgi:hypothetical protein
MRHLPQRLTTLSIPDAWNICPCYNSCVTVVRMTSSLRVKICPEKWSLKGGEDENHGLPNPKCMADGPKFPHRNFWPNFETFVSCAVGRRRRWESQHPYEDWGLFCCWPLASFLAWRSISAVNVSPCSRMSTSKSPDEPRKTMASTLQVDGVTLNSFPWLIADWW